MKQITHEYKYHQLPRLGQRLLRLPKLQLQLHPDLHVRHVLHLRRSRLPVQPRRCEVLNAFNHCQETEAVLTASVFAWSFLNQAAAMSNSAATSDVTANLLAHWNAFKAFVASRIGNEADAEDLLQNGLVKALARADEVNEGAKAVGWFCQILRHAIVDHLRSRNAASRRDDRWASDAGALVEDVDAERQICACFERLLPTLKPTHAELIRRVELQDEPVAQVAAALGMTPNNASVTLHRARHELRTKLVSFCGDCQCLNRCECD